jgi:hypothetical protein
MSRRPDIRNPLPLYSAVHANPNFTLLNVRGLH